MVTVRRVSAERVDKFSHPSFMVATDAGLTFAAYAQPFRVIMLSPCCQQRLVTRPQERDEQAMCSGCRRRTIYAEHAEVDALQAYFSYHVDPLTAMIAAKSLEQLLEELVREHKPLLTLRPLQHLRCSLALRSYQNQLLA